MEKTYSDEHGEFIVRYKGGKKIKVYIGQTVSEAMKKSGKFIFKNKDDKIDKILNSNDTIEELKKITNEKGRLNCCKEVSEKIKEIIGKNNMQAEVKQVTVFANGEMGTIGGHYVVEINNKLYDYTGKQFLGSNNPNDIELRKYVPNKNGFYSENANISDIEEAQRYTAENKEKLIIYK